MTTLRSLALLALLSACGSGSGTGGGDGRCEGNLDCPGGGLCVDGVCHYADGGGDVPDVGPDGAGCEPSRCAEECRGAGFDGGECGERGCRCTRSPDAGDVTPPDVPPNTEICGDALDNDGDGEVDEGCDCLAGEERPCYVGDPAVAGIGVCTRGMQTCEAAGEWGEWGACVGSVAPGEEICDDELDNDCDGSADERCVCSPGDRRPCYTGPAGTAGVGLCADGFQPCVVTDTTEEWGDCGGMTLPTGDLCDGLDNDCDGRTDQGCLCPPGDIRACYDGPPGTRGLGQCYDGTQACLLAPGGMVSDWGPCIGWVGPAASDPCDMNDNDCDGTTDEGCTCRPGETRACYTGPASTRGVPPCRDGSQTCITLPEGSGWDSCSGELLPGAEICGDRADNDCDGRADEDCDCTTIPAGRPPVVTCPAPVSTRALTTVTLTGSATDDCRVDAYRWEVIARPAGAGAAPVSPTSATTAFTPDLVGEYRLRFTATDNEGLSASCEMTVTSTGQGLRVEMIWDLAGDVDLHMLHPSAGAWFSSPYDCYYSNMRPAWDAAGTADDPRLDIDDIPGDGPENINIDVPVAGNTYRVGAHHYASSGCRNVTVRIYCGDISLTPVGTYNRSICGNTGGGSRDFWRVVDVRWNGGDSCSVTPLNTVITDTVCRTTR